MDVIKAIVDVRASQNMTQKELAKRTGIHQADFEQSLLKQEKSRAARTI